MGSTGDFPFDIEQVASLLPIKIRRPVANGVYTDCPFCGDDRGKLKINYENNTWRCNYCGEKGGMLALYSKLNGNISNSEAYRRICDELLLRLETNTDFDHCKTKVCKAAPTVKRAEAPVINRTLSALLGLLKLSDMHREHLKNVRCLTDSQIDKIGFKSTPPFYMCEKLARTLIKNGFTVEGVPGFYKRNGVWTVMFCSYTNGILIPIREIDGMIHDLQIRLDTPLKNEGSNKPGAKYIWFSSSSKPYGTGPGSPIQFLGDKNAGRIYITEGYLKSYIAHALSGKTFIALASANAAAGLEELLQSLAPCGTRTVIDALDIDKFRNKNVAAGAVRVRQTAAECGMKCEIACWNPNYNGIDDLIIALKRPEGSEKIIQKPETDKRQGYRIYQLDISGAAVRSYAFSGIEKLLEAGFTEPPAEEYCLVSDSEVAYFDDDFTCLNYIREKYGLKLPDGYAGRAVAPSDVIELYSVKGSRFFYCNEEGFYPVAFAAEKAKIKSFY